MTTQGGSVSAVIHEAFIAVGGTVPKPQPPAVMWTPPGAGWRAER